MKRTSRKNTSYIIIRIEPHPVHGLDVKTRDVMKKVQALVVEELGSSGRCASVATMRSCYPPSAPQNMWEGSGGLTRQDIPAP